MNFSCKLMYFSFKSDNVSFTECDLISKTSKFDL